MGKSAGVSDAVQKGLGACKAEVPVWSAGLAVG